jgi:hypothetical protein
MGRLYLIRKQNLQFVGPMSLLEFKERLHKMEFGIQDEVSAHCQPWVMLDRASHIKKCYPELTDIIGSELPAAWREETSHARIVTKQGRKIDSSRSEISSSFSSRKEARRRSSSASSSSGKNNEYYTAPKSPYPKLFFVTLLFGVGCGVGFMGYQKMSNKAADEAIPTLAEVNAMVQDPDPSNFLSQFGPHVAVISTKIAKARDDRTPWTPYIRYYAFLTTGMPTNVSSRLVKGPIPAYAPQDCTVDFWNKKWLESKQQTSETVVGSAMYKNAWTKLLSLDPYWIKRRPSKGWIKPKSWFEGCLMTANTALKSMIEATPIGQKSADQKWADSDILMMMQKRLQFQLEIVQKYKSPPPTTAMNNEGSTYVQSLTCLNSADQMASIPLCKVNSEDAGVIAMAEDYASFQSLRVGLDKFASLAMPEYQDWINSSLPKLATEDAMNKLDYGPELKFVKDAIAKRGKMTPGSEKIVQEFFDVYLTALPK